METPVPSCSFLGDLKEGIKPFMLPQSISTLPPPVNETCLQTDSVGKVCVPDILTRQLVLSTAS